MVRNSMSYRKEVHLEIEQVLKTEAKKRSGKPLEEWILAERQAMCDAVNHHRGLLKKSPLSLVEIQRVEDQAVGHSDYAHKFALYCAELVVDAV